MPAVESIEEKRNPTRCDVCGTTMVFGGEFLKSIDGRCTYLKYVCPRRTNEQGCGRVKRVLYEKASDARLKKLDASSFIPA